jgi:hypothetical protein
MMIQSTQLSDYVVPADLFMATQPQSCAIGIITNRCNPQKSTSTRFLSMSLAMQNKPNFPKLRMNLTLYLTRDYENTQRLGTPQKQTQSDPISIGPFILSILEVDTAVLMSIEDVQPHGPIIGICLKSPNISNE